MLCLLTGLARAQDFSITTLTPNNAQVVDVGTLVGDDRGGIAVSGSQALLTGDGATARFNRDTLGSGVSVGAVRDGLVTDLATGTVYLLGNGATPLPYGGGTLNSLIALDRATGLHSTPGFVTVAPATTASYSLTSDQPALFGAPPALAANGTLTFTPAANANGSAVITVVWLSG